MKFVVTGAAGHVSLRVLRWKRRTANRSSRRGGYGPRARACRRFGRSRHRHHEHRDLRARNHCACGRFELIG
jgi:hypothetical protein